ncbi:hypothetical protein KV205_09360 [Streptomyces sp. SKN60]|uniref:hypothetical protein n=1 Tax=Streptomyces sp. SKN60 TaxID=2855506 RepID=UPI0027D2D5D8|nr:hypothetical protein [Streptomyces sp. SKN60]MCX2180732.1 hypothetical protein [Streptomyces sp. SKN60]
MPALRSLALDALDDPPLPPLPEAAAELLIRLSAPPRLVAHLRAVHDAAVRLLDAIGADADARLAFQGAYPVM